MNDSAAILSRNAATAAEQMNEADAALFYHAAPASHKRPRRSYDHYLTPPALAAAALAALPPITPASILDLGAADGVWGIAARRLWPEAHITGIEIRATPKPAAYDTWRIGDALTLPLAPADLVIGNPPYDKAEAFTRRAITLTAPGGMTALLLRLSFLEPTKERAPIFADHPVWRVLVATPRPRFDPDRTGSDNVTAAFLIWYRAAAPSPVPFVALPWKRGRDE